MGKPVAGKTKTKENEHAPHTQPRSGGSGEAHLNPHLLITILKFLGVEDQAVAQIKPLEQAS